MPKKFNTDEWVSLLMDADLTPEQPEQWESRLIANSDVETLSTVRRARMVRGLMKEMADETPAFNNPDFMWSRVKKSIVEEGTRQNPSWKDRFEEIFGLPDRMWAVTASLVLVIGLAVWFARPPGDKESSRFGEILEVIGFNPEATATAYHSRAGKVTVIWIAGVDEYLLPFGEIRAVHSLRPEVSVRAYNSVEGGATIIWTSGMDDEVDPRNETS